MNGFPRPDLCSGGWSATALDSPGGPEPIIYGYEPNGSLQQRAPRLEMMSNVGAHPQHERHARATAARSRSCCTRERSRDQRRRNEGDAV
jgi:hypothetical protein